jgi:hypothetical protein
MDRRFAVLLLAAILVTAIAVPALAGQTTVAPSLDRKSVASALAKAKRALKIARSASSKVKAAREEARAATGQALAAKAAAAGAQLAAGGAKKAADEAGAAAAATQAALDGTKVQKAVAAPEVETESETYVALEGGPSVTVDVPASGLVEVWAQVTIEGEGAVALFQDGTLMPGQSEFCAPEEEGRALLAALAAGGPGEPVTVATPSALSFGPTFVCGSFGPPAPVLFETTEGEHIYELRYKYCGCEEEVTAGFSQRRLYVGPRL